MPTDLLKQTTDVHAYIMDGNNYQMVAKTTTAAAILKAVKPTGQLNTQATGLVSFGKDPNDATQIGQGVGVYSTPYCIEAGVGKYGADFVSNCGITSTYA